MNSSIVNRELRAVVRPFLQTHGFGSFTPRTSWRFTPGRVEVVNFQSFSAYLAEGLACTSYSFSLRLGIYLLAIPARGAEAPKRLGDQLRPEEWQCHLRLTPESGLEQLELARRDIWYIDEAGHYLPAAARDARRAIAEVGLPWCDRWTDAAVLAELRTASSMHLADGTQLPGHVGSPARHYAAGYLARALGERAAAAEFLARALAQYEAMDESNAKTWKRFEPRTPEHLRADVRELGAAV